jgi:FkbM family methyltransferase
MCGFHTMSLLRSLFNQWHTGDPTPPGPAKGITLEQYAAIDPTMEVDAGDTKVVYCIPTPHTKWRVESLFSKEPDTIEWIATFAPDDIFVDVGANVGMYTIWAAKTRGVRVYAFEPESQNYALLQRNIVANKLCEQVTAYCLALSDERRVSNLHLSKFIVGGSCHTFGEKLDFRLQPRDSKISQGCVSATLDELVATGAIEQPHHVKIDVDGFEHKVLDGAAVALRNPALRSVLVEVNTHLEAHRALVERLTALGFNYAEAQVARAMRTSGEFQGCANHVFRR